MRKIILLLLTLFLSFVIYDKVNAASVHTQISPLGGCISIECITPPGDGGGGSSDNSTTLNLPLGFTTINDSLNYTANNLNDDNNTKSNCINNTYRNELPSMGITKK